MLEDHEPGVDFLRSNFTESSEVAFHKCASRFQPLKLLLSSAHGEPHPRHCRFRAATGRDGEPDITDWRVHSSRLQQGTFAVVALHHGWCQSGSSVLKTLAASVSAKSIPHFLHDLSGQIQLERSVWLKVLAVDLTAFGTQFGRSMQQCPANKIVEGRAMLRWSWTCNSLFFSTFR